MSEQRTHQKNHQKTPQRDASSSMQSSGHSSGQSPKVRSKKELQKRKKRKKLRIMIARAIVMTVMLLILITLIYIAVFIGTKIKNGISGKNSNDTVEQTTSVDVTPEFIGLKGISSQTATVSEYFTYGVHLNVEGDFASPTQGVASASLCLVDAYEDTDVTETEAETEVSKEEGKSGLFSFFSKKDTEQKDTENETETETETDFSYQIKQSYAVAISENEDGSMHFTTSEKINEGVVLETVPQGEYCMLLELSLANGEKEYRSLTDSSGEEAIEYYTITHEEKNNKISLSFTTYEELAYLQILCEETTLPDDVYDIVVDAGHGGNDPGTVSGSTYESDLTLSYAQSLKNYFESAGYKVLLTRDGTEGDEKMAYTMYDENGRVNKACRSRAKVCYCIHFNGNDEVTKGGVEVYCSNRANPSFAQLIADNMVTMGNTTYSNMKSYKIADGVYVHAYSQSEIEKSNSVAASKGFEPYALDETVDYLFMIRELGGIATGAYMDGRNPTFGTNLYLNANYGIESFLIEVAYMSVSSDLQNSIDNQDDYVKGMGTAFEEWLTGLYEA